MADNMEDVLQELSDLLSRISQQNQESLQRAGVPVQNARTRRARLGLRQEQQQRDQIKLNIDEIRCTAEKNMWLSEKQSEEDGISRNASCRCWNVKTRSWNLSSDD